MDYEKCIIDLMDKIHNKELLKRVYKLLEYLYLHKDDMDGITEVEKSEPLATELINDMQTTITDIEIALNKARLMIEEILDITDQEESTKDANAALMFTAQQNLLNTKAQIAHDYVIEIQSLINKIEQQGEERE